MRPILSLFILLIAANLVKAQEPLRTNSKKAIQLYQEAYELDSLGNYFQSEPLLREALRRDESFDEAHLLLFLTLMKKGDVGGARQTLEVASTQVEDSFMNRMRLEMATFFWSNGRYEDANRLAKLVGEDIHGAGKNAAQLVKQSIEFAFESQKQSRRINFQELPNPVNLMPGQYFPSLTSNGDMVYTGRIRGRRGEHEDLFITRLNGNRWERPEALSDSINTPRLNEGTASIAADGLSIVFTGCNRPEGEGSCDLYISYYESGEWTRPQNLGKNVNTVHWESQPSLSQDGRQLYFVSTRPGGLGGQDLWVSYKNNGDWSEAINLGNTVNSILDDCSPFIHPDGKTLFYASRGKVGMGGYDLFRTQTVGGTWSEPQNLGYPINTFENQVGYTLGLDGWAYYSDNNLIGQTKLYRFKMPESLLPKVKLDLISGLVEDAKTGEWLSADVFLTDLQKDSTVVETRSKSTGRFSFIPPNKEDDYTVYVNKTGYNLFKRRLSTLDKQDDDYMVKLEPLEVGDKVILNNILFEVNSAALDSEARKELQIAIKFLSDNPNVQVEISGHTDAQGDEDYNMTLSGSRAETVYNYFVQKGISASRLTHQGYGESQPLEGEDQSENSARNRRIELIIKAL